MRTYSLVFIDCGFISKSYHSFHLDIRSVLINSVSLAFLFWEKDDSLFSHPISFHCFKIVTNINSYRWCSEKKGVLRNFAKLAGKHLRQRLFFRKSLLTKSLWHRCFPWNFDKFLRTPFLQNTSGRLLLHKVFFNVHALMGAFKPALCWIFHSFFVMFH